MEGQHSKESIPSSSKALFPLFPAVETVPSDKTEAGATNWLSNESFTPQLAADVQQAFESALTTKDDHDKGLVLLKKRHAELPDTHGGSSEGHKKKKRKHERKKHSPSPLPSGKHMWLEESGLKPEAAYQFDKKRDPDNLLYHTLERSHIARYKRVCHECIGQKTTLELKWDDGRGFKTSKQGKKDNYSPRYFHKQTQEEHETEKISAKSESSTLLPSLAVNVEENSDSESTDFLSLQASAAPGGEEEEQPGQIIAAKRVTEKTGRYNKLLLEDPHNVRLWMEFIAFQEEAMLWGNTPGGSLTLGEGPQDTNRKSEKRRQQMALMERKIAIYEKALEKNPINVELLTGHMVLCQEVWERERVTRRWKDLVFRQPQCAKLWLGYILYCQTHYSSFSTSSLIATYTKALSTLSAILEGSMVSHKPEDNTEEAMVAIFASLCSFLQQAGHTEKALACYQAMVEFNFLSPDSLTHTDVKPKQKLEFFETFWDSGAPRFGECEAFGWNSWFQRETNVRVVQPPPKLGFFADTSLLVSCWREEEEGEEEHDVREETELELTVLRGRSLHNGWVELEQFREKTHFLPWHTEEGPPGVEPHEPDDPDRIVLFDDVAPVLFRLAKESTRVSLLAMFLHFLGAPLSPTLVAVMFPECMSMQLHNQAQVLAPQIYAQGLLSHSAEVFASELTYHSFSVGTSIHPITDLGKFPQKSLQFIHSVFNQTLPLFPQSYRSLFASMWLTLQYSQIFPDVVSFWSSSQKKTPKQLKQAMKFCDRFAKGVLQHDAFRHSTPVWCTYATLKAMCGERDSAVKVVEVVTLQLGQVGTSADGPEALLACKIYVEIVLGVVSPNCLLKEATACKETAPPTQEDLLKAQHCLICLAEGRFQLFSPDKVTSTLLLKGERKLQEKCQKRLAEMQASADAAALQENSFTLFANCLAWLTYLNAGLDSACSFLSQVEDSLVTGSNLQHKIESFDQAMPSDETRKLNQEGLDLAAPLKAALESVVALRVRLIHFHTLHHPTPPSRLRLALTESVLLFPENAHLLWQFATHETLSLLVRRVRRHFDSHLQQAQTAIPWVVATAFEERRRKILQSHTPSPETGPVGVELEELQSGVVNRMRSLYQRGTHHPSGRTCPLLWRAYMKFELLYGSEKAAEAVFYRAVQQCPWAKVLYMDAARSLAHLGGGKVIEMMEEKELRLRAPLEEVQLLKDAAEEAAGDSKADALLEGTSPRPPLRPREGPRS